MSRRIRTDEHAESRMAELAKLRRKYRLMQYDYRAYRDESNMVLIKLNNLLTPLEKEQAELNTLLKCMESDTKERADRVTVVKLTALTQTNTSLGEESQVQQLDITRLKQEISLAKKLLIEQRKRMGGFHVIEEERAYLEKKRAIFENRLNQGVTQFNKQLTVNKGFRDEIDELRSQRAVYSGLYKEMETELMQTKSNLNKVIDQSTLAFEQRDEAKTKMEALRGRKEKDDQMFEYEMRGQLRSIHHEEKIHLFMAAKGNERADYKAERVARLKKQLEARGPAADKLLLQSFEEALKTIEDVAQESNMTVVASDFRELEADNFALYKYANELHDDCQQLQSELGALRGNIGGFERAESRSDLSQYDRMMTLETEYQVVDQDMYTTDKRLLHISRTLDDMCSRIGQLFVSAECDNSMIVPRLDADDKIQPKNICRYLSMLEACVTRSLETYYVIKLRKQISEERPLSRLTPFNLQTPRRKPSLHIVPTSMDDEALSDEDECYPLSEQELRDKVLAFLEKNPAVGVAFQDSVLRLTRPAFNRKAK